MRVTVIIMVMWTLLVVASSAVTLLKKDKTLLTEIKVNKDTACWIAEFATPKK